MPFCDALRSSLPGVVQSCNAEPVACSSEVLSARPSQDLPSMRTSGPAPTVSHELPVHSRMDHLHAHHGAVSLSDHAALNSHRKMSKQQAMEAGIAAESTHLLASEREPSKAETSDGMSPITTTTPIMRNVQQWTRRCNLIAAHLLVHCYTSGVLPIANVTVPGVVCFHCNLCAVATLTALALPAGQRWFACNPRNTPKQGGGILGPHTSQQPSGLINFPTDANTAPSGPQCKQVSNGADGLQGQALLGDQAFVFGSIGCTSLRDVTDLNGWDASCLTTSVQAAQWRAGPTPAPTAVQPRMKRCFSQVFLLSGLPNKLLPYPLCCHRVTLMYVRHQ